MVIANTIKVHKQETAIYQYCHVDQVVRECEKLLYKKHYVLDVNHLLYDVLNWFKDEDFLT